MRFLVDECTGPAVAQWLRDQAHDVFSVYEDARGMTDDQILAKAFAESWIVVTNDKDFGERIFRDKRPHHGVILLRLRDPRSESKTNAIRRLLANHAVRMPGAFVVVTESGVRFALA